MRTPSLIPEWRDVLRKAWSTRLASMAALLLLLDLGAVLLETMGMLDDRPEVSLLLRAASAVLGVASVIARVVAQRGLTR